MSFVFSPKFGGAMSPTVSYPGIKASGSQLKELHYQQCCKVKLSNEDLLAIENVDGASICLLLAIDEKNQTAYETLKIADLENQSIKLEKFHSRALSEFIDQHELDISKLKAKRLFDTTSKTGERITLRSTSALTVWLIFPNLSNDIWQGGGGTFLIETSHASASADILPEPLGLIRDEFRVPRASARAYEVKKGEYIYIDIVVY